MAMAMAITIPIYAYSVHNSHSYCDYIVQLKHLKCHRAPGLQYRRRVTRPCAGNFDNNSEADTAAQVSVSDPLQDDLAAKLAAAEAEAKTLRRELAARRGDREVDLSKLKLAAPEKRIDGTGYRETLFSTPGGEEEQPGKWGLSEAELFLSKGAPTEKTQIGGPAMEDNTKEVVARRLLTGMGLVLAAIGLAFFKLPTGLAKPSKPLFLYVIPIIRLREQLNSIENSASVGYFLAGYYLVGTFLRRSISGEGGDSNSVRLQLKKRFDSGDISKDTFLSAAGYLEGADAELASSTTYAIFDYLNQADYNKYFEYMGQPSISQQLQGSRLTNSCHLSQKKSWMLHKLKLYGDVIKRSSFKCLLS